MTDDLKNRILNRLNDIRREAVTLGYADRYVPLRWSTELEEIAKIRSVHATVRPSHTLPNGDEIWGLYSSVSTNWKAGENLAWNRPDIFAMINQYYDEIHDMPSTPGGQPTGVVGHYEAIIDPNFTSIGTAVFTPSWGGWSANAMWFSDGTTSQSLAGNYGNQTFAVEVDEDRLDPNTARIQLQNGLQIGRSATPSLYATYVSPAETAFKVSREFKILSGTDWRVTANPGNSTVLSNTKNGTVTANAAGTFTLSTTLRWKTISVNSHTLTADQIQAYPLSNPPGIDSGPFTVRNVGVNWKREDIGTGWSSSQYTHVFNAGDLDGNGFEDMMLTDRDGRLWFYPMISDTRFKPRVQVGYGWRNMRLIFGGVDYNGDGNVDILGIDWSGNLFLYPGLGNGYFGAKRVVGTGWSNITNISVAEVGFNGNPIIMGSQNGVLKAWQTDGRGRFTNIITYGGGWNSVKLTAISGDVSGDGIPDMWVVTNSGDLRLYVARDASGTRFAAYKVGTGWGHLRYLLPRTENPRVIRAIFPDGLLRQYTMLQLAPQS